MSQITNSLRPTFGRASQSAAKTKRVNPTFPRFMQAAFLSTIARPLSKRTLSTKIPPCPCKVSAQKIEKLVQEKNVFGLRNHLTKCREAQDLGTNWGAYAADKAPSPSCKAEATLSATLPPGKIDLSALHMQKEKVTLAGEGGAIVGQPAYWQSPLEKWDKQEPVHVVSIGGGVGDDGRAIASVFEKNGFQADCTTVDPNPLAAWLASEKEGQFFVGNAQEYLSQVLKRTDEGRYVFHLGTLLNVVPEKVAIEILRLVAEKMTEKDMLSVIMVDKSQFGVAERQKKISLTQEENEAGLAKYVYTDSGKHYKTVIQDPEKFKIFCSEIGLSVEGLKQEKNTSFPVTFVTLKGTKK